MKNMLPLIFLCLFFTACNKPGKSAIPTNVESKVLTENLNFPWEILWGPDNKIWMTERGGKISLVDPATGVVSPLFTISDVKSVGEGGLLGMALHPDFSNHPQVFVAYDYDAAGTYKEKIVRYDYNGSTLVNPLTIFNNIAAAGNHDGCRLYITTDLKIFITTGDATNTANPQNINSANGKILRINLDGSVPTDNPVAGNPLWTSGHRNPQGLVLVNNTLFSAEHGPDTDDEINIIEKGRNYGWPDVKGFCDAGAEHDFCMANNIKEPIKTWTPTIAPSGLDYYDKDQIPEWKNSLLLAVLKNSRLIQLKLNADHTAITEANDFFVNTYGRMRDICISPQGIVYICTSNGGNTDKIIQVSKKI